MKLLILQEKLKQGLSVVERISSKSITLPILNNILISSEKNFLNLTATDLEIGIKWWALCKTEKEGSITIPSKLFSSFVNLLPNKKIELKVADSDLSLECENYKTKIKGLSADDFPIIPKIGKEEFVLVKNSVFCDSLNQIVDIPVASTTKPEISGVYFSFQKDLAIMAATDSFRLGEKKIHLKNASFINQNHSFIIPQKAAKEIINIFGSREGDMKIYFSPNQILFEYLMSETEHPEVEMISRLIEGEYPNYKDIIPEKFTTQLKIEKSEFLNQIKTASLFSGKLSEVKIQAEQKENKIEISSQSQELGDYQSSISGAVKGEPIKISFNYKFLIDGLANIKSSEVYLEMNGEAGPAVLKPVGDESYLYVVMPIKA